MSETAIGILANKARIKGGKRAVIGEWVRYNNAIGKSYKVLDSTKRNFRSCCASIDMKDKELRKTFRQKDGVCKAHLFSKETADDPNEWEIYSFVSEHTCKDEDCVRKYNYDINAIESASEAVAQSGDAKQICDIGEKESLPISKEQARRILKRKREDSVSVQIAQYSLLDSYFTILRESDPNGTFILESKRCDWDSQTPQFDRCYIRHSVSSHQWSGCIKLVFGNATATKNRIFDQTILLAVTRDGNNEIVLLAYAVCGFEGERNWCWFLDRLIKDFPGMQIFLADFDKGIETSQFQTKLRNNGCMFRRCFKHMCADCANLTRGTSKLKGKEEWLAEKMAKSRNENKYQRYLQDMQKLDKDVADWFNNNCQQFSSYSFLDRNRRSFGVVTNNDAEILSDAIVVAMGKPILDMLMDLTNWVKDTALERAEKAKNWQAMGKQLTPYAIDQQANTASVADTLSMRILEDTDEYVSAEVSALPVSAGNSNTAFYGVKVCKRLHKIDCHCRWSEETGRPCYHGAAVIKSYLQLWNDPRWLDDVYRLDTYKATYSGNVPAVTTAGAWKNVPLHPPESKERKITAKKKRYVPSEKKPRVCGACHQPGHFEISCPDPRTLFRVEKYKKQVKKYINKRTREI